MAERDENLLNEIERDALDEQTSLTAALRRCIALGERTQSRELREWASRELEGYEPDEELPGYRIIYVPLKIDLVTALHHVTGQSISSFDLPELVREHASENLRLTQGVGTLQGLLRSAENSGKQRLRLSPGGTAELLKPINHVMQRRGRTVTALYWDVSAALLEGTLEQIRTTLVRLVAEMRATMDGDVMIPSSEQAAQAVNVVLNGGRNQVAITSAQAASGATAIVRPASEDGSSWAKIQTIWTIVGVVVAVVGAYLAYLQLIR